MNQVQTQIRKAIKNLISKPTTFNPSSPNNTHPFTNTVDLYSTYQHLFNEEAKTIFLNRTNNMVHQYNEKNGPSTLFDVTLFLEKLGLKEAQDNPFDGNYVRKYSIVMCFGFMCKNSDADDAAKQLIDIINVMATNKWINASLYNIGRMNLFGGEECVIFSYLAVPTEHEEHIKANCSAQFPEGGVPPRFK